MPCSLVGSRDDVWNASTRRALRMTLGATKALAIFVEGTSI